MLISSSVLALRNSAFNLYPKAAKQPQVTIRWPDCGQWSLFFFRPALWRRLVGGIPSKAQARRHSPIPISVHSSPFHSKLNPNRHPKPPLSWKKMRLSKSRCNHLAIASRAFEMVALDLLIFVFVSPKARSTVVVLEYLVKLAGYSGNLQNYLNEINEKYIENTANYTIPYCE